MKRFYSYSCILTFSFILFLPTLFASFRELRLSEIDSIKLMGPQMNPLKIYVGNSRHNKEVIVDIKKALKEINESAKEIWPPIKLIVLQSPYQNDFYYDDFREIFPRDRLDLWLRDFGKFATIKLKGSDKEELAVIDLNRGRHLEGLSEALARAEGIYYFKAQVPSIAGNYGGNVDVTPNNVFYIGDSSSQQLQNIFIDKGYRENYVVLRSNWLMVGHVDEFISTIILPKNEKCRIGIVKASPLKALELIDSTHPSVIENVATIDPLYSDNLLKLKNDLDTYHNELMENKKKFFADFMKNSVGIDIQQRVAKIIDSNVEKLTQAIAKKSPECANPKIIEFPTLYICDRYFNDQNGNYWDNYDEEEHNGHSFESNQPIQCRSYLPGSVNMSVIRNHLLIPDPILETFKSEIEKVSLEAGQVPHFIDDMPYHYGIGEIHCGTNCLHDKDKNWSNVSIN